MVFSIARPPVVIVHCYENVPNKSKSKSTSKSIKKLKQQISNKKEDDIQSIGNLRKSEVKRTKHIIHAHKNLINELHEELKDFHEEFVGDEEPKTAREKKEDLEEYFK